MKNQLNIATFNISGGVSKDDGENYFDQEKSTDIDRTFFNEIVSFINKENIDIIAFQEIITTDSVKYIEGIKKETNLKYSSIHELSECNLVENTNCGLAILSKYPIIEELKKKFTNPNLTITTKSGMTYYSYDKGLLKVKIDVEGKIINFTTCHFLPFGRFNETAFNHKEIYKELEDMVLKDSSFILMGDFNTDRISNLIDNVDKKTVKIFDKMLMNGAGKYDNIFITKDFKLISKKEIKSLSDHYLCIASIQY